jgi:hypothetical protein
VFDKDGKFLKKGDEIKKSEAKPLGIKSQP